ncbi:MAG: protein-PII uridylyltransferase [Alcanivorax borkumensis]|uniref:Bifunctional uridylyltransferase/uridylyl-removing enzyme n=1 Tax=Alcanivorax borkumensis (strain ATCC 700651 / DSM 11573 / NCIMB 13689 / SK2) TaxID=393595 RepID=Q0VQF9_ALCBS|nr:[protein-PII] uridylyltransferase [Alcanivorax borkumensis]OJH07652.1 MAG: protein-PII uridylyltransferase [Alcanivorax borkumensis]CAL16589.1 protein-pII uridylyltransferase [Alcanivorax borkumensis SK2]
MSLLPAISQDALLDALQESAQPGQYARQFLAQGQERLNQAFETTDITELVQARAGMVDQVMIAAWSLFGLANRDDVALVAVGGYGRGELHPCSDVDLLVLLSNAPEQALRDSLERFVAFLWDMGLEIGHAVRTLDECVDLARDDITVATNIMEARTLAGNDILREQLEDRTGPEHMWDSAAFFAAKWQEQTTRHKRFNDTEYNLEPDLKNAPGGLRDVQMIAWVAKRHFNTDSLEALVSNGFLTPEEYGVLRKCLDYLWEVRWQLHVQTERNENRLLFDHQRQLADRLGHENSSANLAVEHFMKDFYRVALALSVLNEMLLQLFDEVILRSDTQEQVRPLNRRFQVRNDYLEISNPDVFEQHPSALLEAFVLMAQNPDLKGIRASTVRALIYHRRQINDAFRNDPTNTNLFMQLLRSPHALFSQLRRMKRYGILGKYLPEFGNIIGMMQYDLFHIYTVDAHTLLVIKNMRRLRYEDLREEFPLASEVFYRLPKPELLYASGLYHDIAKGRGGDHSELGADDAIAFCQRHGLTAWDGKLVAWLVRNHLTMSVTAQRKDISDPDVVYDFARKVGDLVHLDYLYVLTVADINATNPTLWNSWRASLLRQLYTETKRALRRGLNNPVEKQDWIDETRDAALRLLTDRDHDGPEIETLWANIGDEYFLRETPRDIAWHTEALLDREDPEDPLVLIRESSQSVLAGGSQIFIYTPDTRNLFSATVNAIDSLGLTIMDARIITSVDGFSLDTYIVLDEQGTPIGEDWARIEQIRKTLTETLKYPDRYASTVSRRMPRRNKHFDVPTQVVISNDIVNDRTAVDIQTLDRPGLLAHIGRIFMRFEILVQNARIATLGERAEDVFFITDLDGEPVSDPTLCQELQQTLKQELDAKNNGNT